VCVCVCVCVFNGRCVPAAWRWLKAHRGRLRPSLRRRIALGAWKASEGASLGALPACDGGPESLTSTITASWVACGGVAASSSRLSRPVVRVSGHLCGLPAKVAVYTASGPSGMSTRNFSAVLPTSGPDDGNMCRVPSRLSTADAAHHKHIAAPRSISIYPNSPRRRESALQLCSRSQCRGADGRKKGSCRSASRKSPAIDFPYHPRRASASDQFLGVRRGAEASCRLTCRAAYLQGSWASLTVYLTAHARWMEGGGEQQQHCDGAPRVPTGPTARTGQSPPHRNGLMHARRRRTQLNNPNPTPDIFKHVVLSRLFGVAKPLFVYGGV